MSFGSFVIATLALNLAPGPDMTYVAARGGAALQTIALGAWFITSGTIVNVAVAWLARSARALLQSRSGRAWVQRVSGAILVALGVRLALARST